MSEETPIPWDSLERWSATVFLVAGGLLLVSGTINALDLLPNLSTQQGAWLFVEGTAGFGGVVLAFVGLLGLYPALADEAADEARAGVALVAAPAGFVLVLLLWEVLVFPVGLPSLTAMIPRLDLVTGLVVFLFALGSSIFGVLSLRTDRLPRPVAGLLFVFAAAWLVFLGAVPAYGFPVPTWLTVVYTATMAGALLGIGRVLRSATAQAERAESMAA